MKPISQLIDCANRELALRRKHYPGWISNGKMTREKSEHELECMEEILKVLQLRKDLEEATEEMKQNQPFE